MSERDEIQQLEAPQPTDQHHDTTDAMPQDDTTKRDNDKHSKQQLASDQEHRRRSRSRDRHHKRHRRRSRSRSRSRDRGYRRRRYDRSRSRSRSRDRDRDRHRRSRRSRPRSRGRDYRNHRRRRSPSPAYRRSRSPRPRSRSPPIPPLPVVPSTTFLGGIQQPGVPLATTAAAALGGLPTNPLIAAAAPPGGLNPLLNPALFMNTMPNMTGGSAPTRSSKRLYVGGFPLPTTDHQIISFLNAVLIALRIVTDKGSPVLRAEVNNERAFAFVDFQDVKDATAALALDGVMYNGNVLKVRRPKDYVRPPGVVDPAPLGASTIASMLAQNTAATG